MRLAPENKDMRRLRASVGRSQVAEGLRQDLAASNPAERHGSFHANAAHASIGLGLANEETDELAANLLRYQWPGGGWNCNKLPRTKGPTIVHTAYGLRGLVTYQSRSRSKARRPRVLRPAAATVA